MHQKISFFVTFLFLKRKLTSTLHIEEQNSCGINITLEKVINNLVLIQFRSPEISTASAMAAFSSTLVTEVKVDQLKLKIFAK